MANVIFSALLRRITKFKDAIKHEKRKRILQRLTTLEEGMEETTQSYLIEDHPMYVIFYDKKNKGCVAVDLFGMSDIRYKEEEKRLADYVKARPERFIRLPNNDSEKEWGIMCDFAEKKQISELSYALGGDRPMKMFKKQVTELNLDMEWIEFRKRAYEKFIEEWIEGKEI